MVFACVDILSILTGIFSGKPGLAGYIGVICPVSSPVPFFYSKSALGFGRRFQNSFACCSLTRYMIFKLGKLLGDLCSFSILSGQLSLRHCWKTCNACRVPC